MFIEQGAFIFLTTVVVGSFLVCFITVNKGDHPEKINSHNCVKCVGLLYSTKQGHI